MGMFAWVCLLLLASLHVSQTEALDIVKCDASCGPTSPYYNKILVIVHGYVKELIAPAESYSALVQNFNEARDIKEFSEDGLLKLKQGKAIPSLKLRAHNPDEAMRVEVLKVYSLYENFPPFESVEKVCDFCKNAALALWNKQLFVTWESMITKRTLNFYFANLTIAPLMHHSYLNYSYMNYWRDSPENCMRPGADARMVSITDDLLVVACEHPRWFMSLIEFRKRRNNTIDCGESRTIFTDTDRSEPQKNWVPFLYQHKLHFLQHIVPMRTVVLEASNKTKVLQSKTLYITNPKHIPWDHGSIRGGSNAVRIGNVYLAFFHSRYDIPNNAETTYVFGAYTFSAHPPFTMKSITPYPLYYDQFLSGKWFNKYFDYINYPTSLLFDEKKHMAYVTIGYNDWTTWMLKYNVTTLLDSMVQVE